MQQPPRLLIARAGIMHLYELPHKNVGCPAKYAKNRSRAKPNSPNTNVFTRKNVHTCARIAAKPFHGNTALYGTSDCTPHIHSSADIAAKCSHKNTYSFYTSKRTRTNIHLIVSFAVNISKRKAHWCGTGKSTSTSGHSNALFVTRVLYLKTV